VSEHHFSLIEAKLLHLDDTTAREAAAKHLALPQSKVERDFEEPHARWLAERVRGGKAIPFLWMVAVCQGKHYRINGRHSAQMIHTYEGELPSPLVVLLARYDTPTEPAMADLFRQCDARRSSRSMLDISGAYQGIYEDIASCNKKNAKMALEGVNWYLRVIKGHGDVPKGEDLYEQFGNAELHPFIRWFDQTSTAKTPELRFAPVVGAMYSAFLIDRPAAEKFWREVALNNAGDDGQPSSMLASDLLKRVEGELKLEPKQVYARCVHAFNSQKLGKRPRTLEVNIKKGIPDIAA
jgi:hypothetical protein